MSRMKSEDYGREYWEGGVGSEYHNYADDPGWPGILVEILDSGIEPGSVIREAGSAHGYFLHHAGRWGYDAEGIDISEYAVTTGLQRMPHLAGKLHLGTVSDSLPWETESADVVFSSEFLEHVVPEELDFVVGEMLRVLKPGGLWLHKIGIVVPDNHPFRQPTVEDHSAHFTHFTVRTREEWMEHFARLGLVHYPDLEARLDERFAGRDWVMRFFAWRKPE
jgi:SAM-dependent methyltransferase